MAVAAIERRVCEIDTFCRSALTILVRCMELCGVAPGAAPGTADPATAAADPAQGGRPTVWEVRARVERAKFMTMNLDGVIVGLSDIQARLRVLRGEEAEPEPGAWVPPDSFDRKTTKYWVRLDRVVMLKVLLVRHLPLLIFDRSSASPPMEFNEARKMKDSGLITSVYFDNDELSCYKIRLSRAEGATLVRFRWYGDHRTTDTELFLERKTHHESWVDEKSVKERLSIKEGDAGKFIAGSIKIDEDYLTGRMKKKAGSGLTKSLGLVREIQEEVLARELVPKLRTRYFRTAFQLSTNNDVRVSLDTELSMTLDRLTAAEWCRREGLDDPTPDETVYCPYAVLEVKLGVPEPPPWIEAILAATGTVYMNKFSKFLNGMASLYPSAAGELPYWFDWADARDFVESLVLDGKGIDLANASSVDLPVTSHAAPVGGEAGAGGELAPAPPSPAPALVRRVPSLSGKADPPPLMATQKAVPPAPQPPPKPIARPTITAKPAMVVRNKVPKVEPKTYFANERTLLNWISILVLMAIVSLSALAYGRSSRDRLGIGAGASLAAVTVFFGIRAVSVYFKRNHALTRGHVIRYDDPYGPPALIGTLLCVLVVVTIIAVNGSTTQL